MIDILKIYFLVGFIVIGIEWAIILFGGGKPFPHYTNPLITFASVVFIFLIEVLIWPRQAFVMFYSLYRLLAGKCSYAELMEEVNDDE